MSSIEDRLNSVTIEQKKTSGGTIQLPGLISQLSPVEQLSFPDSSPFPFGTTPFPGSQYASTPGVTRPLTDPSISPGVTRNLAADIQTGAYPSLRSTTALRQPVVIRSTGKKSTGMRPPKGRRWVVQLSVTVVMILIAVGTLMAVAPAGTYGETGFNPFRPVINWVEGSNNNPSLLAEQAATVTAVTRDGFQPSSNQSYTGLPSAPSGTSGYDGFTYGQCTYYADFRYHQLTGNWVPWGGNAWEWAAGARASGWNVSSIPHVPSIIVLQPGVQGAGYFGHVAVVERINTDGTVYTTSWNWYANG
ncbi:MAG TPA: CHAP domain-containing protein, partial [Ktedonobacteraceae bacterium]|nr:CHAP domain-containing protein [Ktedonobacteraceae bacterium]